MTRLGAPGFRAATIANYATVGGQSLRTLIVARILSPAQFGILNITNVGSNLTAYTDIGAGIHGERLAAEERGRGDLEASRRRLIESGGARMFPALVFAGLLAAGAVVAWMLGLPETALPLAFIAVSAPLMALWLACRGWLHVHGEIRSIMWCQMAQVTIWLTIVPAAAFAAGLPGALFAMAFSYVPPIAIASRWAPVTRLVVPRWTALRNLVGHGFALWVIQLSMFGFVNSDQVIISTLAGSAALGHYAIAMLVATALAALSDGAALSGHVKTLETVARQGYLSPRIPSVTTVMHTAQAGFGILVPLAWVGAAVMIHFFLPQYVAGLPAVALLGAGMSLMGVVVSSNSALLSCNLHRRVPFVYLCAIAVKAVAAYFLVSVWPGVVGVAAASLLGSLTVGLGMVLLLSTAFRRPRRSVVRLATEFLTGGVTLAILAIWVVSSYLENGVSGFLVTSLYALPISVAVHAAVYLWFVPRRPNPPSPPTATNPRESAPVGERTHDQLP